MPVLRRFTIAGLLALTLGGCWMDVFHDTSWPTLCEIDPSKPECQDDGGTAEGGDGGGDARYDG